MALPLPDDQVQALILAETGGARDAVAAMLLPQWWLLYSVKEAEGAGLQYWYTRRAVLDFRLQGLSASAVTVKIGDDQISGKDIFAAVKALRDEADAEILKIEGNARSGLRSFQPVSGLPSAYDDYLKTTREF